VCVCVQGYDNSESSVRKAAVFCLVAVYLVVGEDLRQHLAPLSTSKVHDHNTVTVSTHDTRALRTCVTLSASEMCLSVLLTYPITATEPTTKQASPHTHCYQNS